MNTLRTAIGELLGLVVEDGFVALGAIGTIAVAAVASDQLGSPPTLGIAIFAGLAGSLLLSLRRAVR
jgi:hypothetical protein